MKTPEFPNEILKILHLRGSEARHPEGRKNQRNLGLEKHLNVMSSAGVDRMNARLSNLYREMHLKHGKKVKKMNRNY